MATRTDFAQSTSEFSDVIDNNDTLIVSLKRYMNQYELAKDDIHTNANFVCDDHQYRKRFFVPLSGVPQMMHHLMQCRAAGVTLHFQEISPMTSAYEEGSGLAFDFEFKTSTSSVPFEDVINDFLKFLFEGVLFKLLRVPKCAKEQFHCVLLGSPSFEYVEDTRLYINKYKVIIPGIQVGAPLKKYIFTFLWRSKTLQEVFKKKTGISFRGSFQYNARCVPSSLIGSCTADEKSYLELMSIQKITIENGDRFEGVSMVSNPAALFSNIIYECSLNHQMPVSEGGIVTKKVYMPRSGAMRSIAELGSEPEEQLSRAYDDALVEISNLSIYDNVFRQFETILNMISKERANSADGRKGIIASLASDRSGKYRCIALWFCYNRCKDMTLTEFNEMWLTALNTVDVCSDLKSLRYWAGLDAPSRMRIFLETQVRQMLLRDAKDIIRNGSIGHSNMASYLKFMFKNVFATIVVAKSVHWYEFVTPHTNNYQKGQLYKWKCVGSQPSSLHEYLSNDLPEITKKVLLEMAQEINSAKDESRKKYLYALKTKFITSMKKVGDVPFKRHVIDDAAHKFADDNLIRRMDKTKHIMGVGNGVLEFDGPNVTLLDHYHSYPITLYTETDYIPYDPENEYIKTVYRMLYSLFPKSEYDALDFILFYFSTSLDWFPKESLFLIITGQGCHSIDTPIQMYDGSIKMVQHVTPGDRLMGDDNTPRIVQELFRGTDEMVQITPTKSASFVVNKSHILSLKFVNLPSHRAQYDIIPNASTIKDDDVIDIAVEELRKWPKECHQWVTLYTSQNDSEVNHFTMESIGEGDYYGFELDSNHRYITGDGVVHHNSNGKSILIEFFRETIGEMYARRMPLSFITDQSRTKSASADPAMMEMKHARFVNYSESETNERASIARIKELTGGDTMAGRQLYGEQENFKPNCNHLLATNHHLRIESTEHAVWRRFLTYKFKMTFKENPNPDNEFECKKDPKFINMLKDDKRYHSAFLAILTHYRSRLYAEYDGQILQVPHPTIKEETDVYRQQEDIYERFIMQRVFFKEGKPDQSLDEFLTIFRNYYRNENGERLKIKNDDLRHLFLNSSIQSYIKQNPSGLYGLRNVYTVDEAAPPMDGSVLFKTYRKTMSK